MSVDTNTNSESDKKYGGPIITYINVKKIQEKLSKKLYIAWTAKKNNTHFGYDMAQTLFIFLLELVGLATPRNSTVHPILRTTKDRRAKQRDDGQSELQISTEFTIERPGGQGWSE